MVFPREAARGSERAMMLLLQAVELPIGDATRPMVAMRRLGTDAVVRRDSERLRKPSKRLRTVTLTIVGGTGNI